MKTGQLITNGDIKDGDLGVMAVKNYGDHVDNKSESEIVSQNCSEDEKFSKIVPEYSFLECPGMNNSPESKNVSDDSSLNMRFCSPESSVPDSMNVLGVNTVQKKFSLRRKVVPGAIVQRRFSPRLKNIPESERPCYVTSRKSIRHQQDEQTVDVKDNVDSDSNHISNLDVSSDISGMSDSKFDLHSFEQNGLQEECNRRDSVICSMRINVGISDFVISATGVKGGCHKNNAQEARKWLNSCNTKMSAEQKGAHERVKETIRTFNIYYQQCVQEEDNKVKKLENNVQSNANGVKRKRQDIFEDHVKASKRPDLKALSKMFGTKAIMYPMKRFGHLPGIDVGYQFHSRAEMVALGFHSDWLYKIDYMGESYKEMAEYRDLTFPLAVAIVLSGEYEEDRDNSEDICDTGEDRADPLGNKHQFGDQVMSSCNIALKNNLEQSIPVRVVWGEKADETFQHKVYTYDGLYEVRECWIQKATSGILVYKYRLSRLQGQPKLTTNQVYLTRKQKVDIPPKLPGLVCMDVSGGQEESCIPAFNLIDDAPFPSTGFTYYKDIQVAENVELPANADGCRCKGNCRNPKTCACARLNGSKFPYVRHDGGRLLKAKDVVFECGPNCGCGPDCINRISQRAIKYQLEVFRTPDRGWAVRTRDFIPSGASVCEYVGVLRRTADADKECDNDYVFEIDCVHTINGVDGREKRWGNVAGSTRSALEKIDDQVLQSTPEFCVDAGTAGNVARFINHSCEPNLFVQCVLSTHHDMRFARVVLFAAENIAPLQEITYDYGYALDSVVGPDGKIKEQPCYCGTAGCRKRLY